ncbi:MAG TPA: hypothetical protein H9862_01200 [Candidatus Akkermansia intestinigallinarum]|uniref:PEP-CTERM protein-sorting domain-containing protein n=1 Tax=Candidatus Akkermansia intestinigallinarum TaxID=2838431 RepID=A0A9D1V9U3_9BACT|nr:hypothetical protein [Candidatus Akkermansia intestinigallinarum]
MKKTLFILAAALCGTASAALQKGDVFAVTFTGQETPSSYTFDGTVLEQPGKVNAVKVDGSNNMTTSGNLVTMGNTSAGISISFSNAAGCGTGGVIQSYKPSVTGSGDLYDVFDATIITGEFDGGTLVNPNGACVNAAGGSMTMTLTGLNAGETYNLFVLVGRGNSHQTGSSDSSVTTYTLGGGVTDVTSTLIGASNASTSVSGAVLNSYEYNAGGNTTESSWSLVEYTFTATSDSVNIATGGTNGNFNAFALQQVTPEPTTATLSLLALAGLCARRRRK